MTKILFISNGHGEDLNASLIAEALKNLCPHGEISAFPIVGEGMIYRNKHIEVVAPTKIMPSGGMFYQNSRNLWRDIFSGFIGLTIRQLITLRYIAKNYDLVVGVGDVVPIILAFWAGRPFLMLFVAYTSYYGSNIKLPFPCELLAKSSLCRGILTKDQFTAEDLQKQGIKQVECYGYPIMDALPLGEVRPSTTVKNSATIAILPGSRIPEAVNNLALLLPVCEKLTEISQENYLFRTALVSAFNLDYLKFISQNYNYDLIENNSDYILTKTINDRIINIELYYHKFSDILHSCDLVLGMAGTAIEQAVGLGKPVVQVTGAGPQFTANFARSQMRYLGTNIKTIFQEQEEDFAMKGAEEIVKSLANKDYLEQCKINGKTRVGGAGASVKIAEKIMAILS
ncbi:MAG: hypothetical protein IGQ45_15510 [Cyanobacterium sp. T60_A2020_053]|nr:hypothetical protein [Cyanobacterium sp. T60_A2020_053]